MDVVVFEEGGLSSEEALVEEGLSDWSREDLEFLTVVSISSGWNRLAGEGAEAITL